MSREVRRVPDFDANEDTVVIRRFGTVADFREAWDTIGAISRLRTSDYPNTDQSVNSVHVFSHASYQDSVNGLEFQSGTLDAKGIASLPRLPWGNNQSFRNHGSVVLHGCNTGRDTSSTGVSVAQNFADSQGVKTDGETGYAYLSSSPSVTLQVISSEMRAKHGRADGLVGFRGVERV